MLAYLRMPSLCPPIYLSFGGKGCAETEEGCAVLGVKSANLGTLQRDEALCRSCGAEYEEKRCKAT